jgi:hypothetical protein
LGHLVEARNKTLNPSLKNPRSWRVKKAWMSKWRFWIMLSCTFQYKKNYSLWSYSSNTESTMQFSFRFWNVCGSIW